MIDICRSMFKEYEQMLFQNFHDLCSFIFNLFKMAAMKNGMILNFPGK